MFFSSPVHQICLSSDNDARPPAQVTAAEGFGKVRLFEILDDLEGKTRPIMEAARKRLAEGEQAALRYLLCPSRLAVVHFNELPGVVL